MSRLQDKYHVQIAGLRGPGLSANDLSIIEHAANDAIQSAGFSSRANALTFASKMATGGQITVRTSDAGTHAAVAGEVRLDGTTATAAELIPNAGIYTKQASGALWRTASLSEQIAKAAVDEITGSIYQGDRSRSGVRAIVGLTPSGKASFWIDIFGRPRWMQHDLIRMIKQAAAGGSALTQISALRAMVIPSPNLIGIGDSLTAYSGSWFRQLGGLANVSSIYFAVGGMQSSEIVGRIGARPFLVTVQSNTILASGATTIIACGMYDSDGTFRAQYPINNQGPTFKLRLDGILGTFSSATYDSSGKPTALVFTPDAGQISSNRTVIPEVETSAADAEAYRGWTICACFGENELAYPDAVIENMKALRRWALASQVRILFVAPPSGTVGGVTYGLSNPTAFTRLRKIELAAQDLFVEASIVSRTFLMRYGDGSTADNNAISDGRVPPSMTSDGLHWIPATSHLYIAQEALRKLKRLGWEA